MNITLLKNNFVIRLSNKDIFSVDIVIMRRLDRICIARKNTHTTAPITLLNHKIIPNKVILFALKPNIMITTLRYQAAFVTSESPVMRIKGSLPGHVSDLVFRFLRNAFMIIPNTHRC